MPKVTKESIAARIASGEYTRLGATTTVCWLTLDNGFTVIGTSACVDPTEFNEQMGEEIAYTNAFNKIWELEGYLLADKIWAGKEITEGSLFTFSKAIKLLKNGYKVARTGWNGKGMWLALQSPDYHSKMTLPYIYMKTADNHKVPWLASQTDILAEDWVLVD